MDTDPSLQGNITILVGHFGFIGVVEDHPFTFTTLIFSRHVVVTDNHILRWGNDWFTVTRTQNVGSSQHQQAGFRLSFIRQRNVDSHLVTIKVGVVSGTYQWVEPHGLSRNQNWFEGLDPQPVQGRCPVQQYWVFLNNIFQYIEDIIVPTVNLPLGSLHVG